MVTCTPAQWINNHHIKVASVRPGSLPPAALSSANHRASSLSYCSDWSRGFHRCDTQCTARAYSTTRRIKHTPRHATPRHATPLSTDHYTTFTRYSQTVTMTQTKFNIFPYREKDTTLKKKHTQKHTKMAIEHARSGESRTRTRTRRSARRTGRPA